MSERALERLLLADCGSTEKLVLLAVAHHGTGASGSGGWPSVRRIARIAGVSTSTAQVALRSLAKRGWLSWQSGSAKANSSNRYTINAEAIKLLDFDLYRPAAQGYGGSSHRPVASAVPASATGLWRNGQKPVATTGNESSTEPINLKEQEDLQGVSARLEAQSRAYFDKHPEAEWAGHNSHTLKLAIKGKPKDDPARKRIETELAARQRGEREATRKQWRH